MKRTILALAIATVSFAAFAGPPPTAGPVNVNVVNPLPLPVSPQVALVPLANFAGLGLQTVNGTSTRTVEVDSVISGFTISAANNTNAVCTVSFMVGGYASLYDAGLLPQAKETFFVSIPYMHVPQGTEVILSITAVEGQICEAHAMIYSYKMD